MPVILFFSIEIISITWPAIHLNLLSRDIHICYIETAVITAHLLGYFYLAQSIGDMVTSVRNGNDDISFVTHLS